MKSANSSFGGFMDDDKNQNDLDEKLPLSEEELDLMALILDEERPLHSGL